MCAYWKSDMLFLALPLLECHVPKGDCPGQWANKGKGTCIFEIKSSLSRVTCGPAAQISHVSSFLELLHFGVYFFWHLILFPFLCRLIKLRCESFRKCRFSMVLGYVLEWVNSIALGRGSINIYCLIPWIKLMCQLGRGGDKSDPKRPWLYTLNFRDWTVNAGPASHGVVSSSLRATQGSRPALTNMVAASHTRYLIIHFD